MAPRRRAMCASRILHSFPVEALEIEQPFPCAGFTFDHRIEVHVTFLADRLCAKSAIRQTIIVMGHDSRT
jgi:hypothetical protein